MDNRLCIGIDTSCYTTSLTIVDEELNILYENSILLRVDKGQKGLRQSEAIFQHLKNLPIIFANISKKVELVKIKAVAASTRPRPVENSYMPVFNVSDSVARMISGLLGIPMLSYSHQEGHIQAGVTTTNMNDNEPFIVLHISGGTNEVLHTYKNGFGYSIDRLAGTNDISAGQLIDRVGVAMGLSFPCGKEMDELALGCSTNIDSPNCWVKDMEISFSGPETMYQRLIQQNIYRPEEIAKSIFLSISNSLARLLINCINKTKVRRILLVGGVASSTFIYNSIKETINKKIKGIEVYQCNPKYSTDNAFGIACLGIKEIIERERV